MTNRTSHRSVSGVLIADDFRDNLIVDRYDPCFISMRASKKKHLRSENSEDVLTWNVFRSLRQLSPESWLNSLAAVSFDTQLPGHADATTTELWKEVAPPPSLLYSGDEGVSEIDIVLENPEWVWFIEAKYKSDISGGTTTRPDRDQILRNIDVGSYFAGVREFYFSFLCLGDNLSPKGIDTINRYQDLSVLKENLPHRTDELSNIQGIGITYWHNIAATLQSAASFTPRKDETTFAIRALEWMALKGINP